MSSERTLECGVVLPAAGASRRFGIATGRKKQLIEIAGRPLLHRSLDVFAGLDAVRTIVVVVPAAGRSALEEIAAAWCAERAPGRTPRLELVEGGARRQDSVRHGLEVFWDELPAALVHDAARPLVRPDDVERVLAGVAEDGAAVLGYPATDSIKRATSASETTGTEGGAKGHARVERSEDRSRIWQVQTPQGALCEHFRRAYGAASASDDVEWADEVALLETVGVYARLVEGARDNIKITQPGDEALAAFLLAQRATEGPR